MSLPFERNLLDADITARPKFESVVYSLRQTTYMFSVFQQANARYPAIVLFYKLHKQVQTIKKRIKRMSFYAESLLLLRTVMAGRKKVFRRVFHQLMFG